MWAEPHRLRIGGGGPNAPGVGSGVPCMDRPLRIAFVIQNLAGLRGGAERVLVTTARGLAERGHEVRILTYDSHLGAPAYDPGPVAVEPVFPGASGRRSQPAGYGRPGRLRQMVKAAPNLPPFGQVKWLLTHGLFARRLRKALARHVPDVVVAFMPPAITAVATAIAGLSPARRPAFVASIRSEPAADFDDASPRWDQNPVYRRRARQALAQADAITILQPDFAAWFPAGLQARLAVLPNAVQRLSPAQTPAPPREPLILSVGRLAPEKGHAILIDAFARLTHRHPDWRLVILGEGS